MGGDGRVRVLSVIDALAAGGAEQVAVDVANTLDRERFAPYFCATREGGPLVERLHSDVHLDILGRRATWDVAKLIEFGRKVRQDGIQIIHSHGRGTLKFVAAAKLLGLVDVPHVYHDHFGWLHTDRQASTALRLAFRSGVDAYMGVDSRLCAWASSTAQIPSDRVHLVHSGVDLDRFEGSTPRDLRQEYDLPADAVVFVMVANFRSPKDHPTLFRAMHLLPDDVRSRMYVLICGATDADPEYFAGCTAMIERLDLASHVRIIGPQSDIPGLLGGADAAVMSSKNETGPLVVLEYMASGLPFVATDTGEITAAVRDSCVGLVPAPRDHVDVADALSALLRMPESERRAMGARGREEVRRRFDQRIVTARIEAVYEDLLGSARDGQTFPAAEVVAGTTTLSEPDLQY